MHPSAAAESRSHSQAVKRQGLETRRQVEFEACRGSVAIDFQAEIRVGLPLNQLDEAAVQGMLDVLAKRQGTQSTSRSMIQRLEDHRRRHE